MARKIKVSTTSIGEGKQLTRELSYVAGRGYVLITHKEDVFALNGIDYVSRYLVAESYETIQPASRYNAATLAKLAASLAP